MSDQSSSTFARPAFGLVILIISLVLIALAPSGQSLWSDEGHSWRFLASPTFSDCMMRVAADTGSQAQMPGYFAFGWLSGKLFGFSEWGLRAPNILWGWLGALSLFFIGRQFRAPVLPLLLAVNPFACYYLDEARPYAMQIGGACLLSWAVARLFATRRFDTASGILWLAGALTVASASMLGTFPLAAATLAAVLICLRRKVSFARSAVVLLALCHVALLALGGYFAWTLIRGAEGAKLWSLGISNVAFAFYEMLGLSGMGPGRVELREAAWTGQAAALALLARYVPGLAATSFFLGAAALASLRMVRGAARDFALLCLGMLSLGLLFLVGAAFVAGFPFWGRHLAPLLPWILIPLGLGLTHSSISRWLRLGALTGIILCWLAASWNFRFAERHSKDNYRAAAAFAKNALAGGHTVWWVADPITADYYKLPVSDGEEPAKATGFFRPTQEAFAGFKHPDVILFARPAQMDELGGLRDFLAKNEYVKRPESWTAFTVWARP